MRKIIFLAALIFSQFAVNAQQANTLNLMPVPKQLALNAGKYRISPKFTAGVKTEADDKVLYKAVTRAYQALNRKTGLVFGQQYITEADKPDSASLVVTVKTAANLAIGVDESYSLRVTEKQIVLNAPTTIGALRGLQTLIQLLAKDDNGYYFPAVAIDDSPRFRWRGLMIDVARHFISFEEMKKNIDAMAAVKMNVLHWHLSDDEGFRVESKMFPQLHVKGSNGDYYTQAQLKEIVAYAKDRGIIIVPEFDMPGHAQSWFAGFPELASQPGPYHPGNRMQWQKEHPEVKAPPAKSIPEMIANMVSPTFDPTNEKVYAFLDRFIGEMTTIFPAGYMHIGADENNGMAWKLNPAIVAWMKEHDMQSTDELQRYYVQRIYEILKKHNRQLIGWEEIYNNKLPADAIVHKWIPSDNGMVKPSGTASELAAHHTVLVSEGFYTDVFMPAYIYYNNPALAGANNINIWGGEAAQWTEIADNDNIDARIWPRTGAIAERLWSPAGVTDVEDMYRRMFMLSSQLDEQGLSHVSNYERALRRLTNNEPTEHLKTLTDVLSPVKGYRKLMAAMFKPAQTSYQTTPLTAVSDIIFVDSEVKRKFRGSVKAYLATHDKTAADNIKTYLLTWKNNDDLLKPLIPGNRRLKEVEEQSKNLSAAAAIALEAMDKTGDANWTKHQLDKLAAFEKPRSETEIAVLPEIEALVSGKFVAEPGVYSQF